PESRKQVEQISQAGWVLIYDSLMESAQADRAAAQQLTDELRRSTIRSMKLDRARYLQACVKKKKELAAWIVKTYKIKTPSKPASPFGGATAGDLLPTPSLK